MVCEACAEVRGVLRGLVFCAASLVAAVAAAQPRLPAAPYIDRPIASVLLTIEGTPTTDPALLDTVQTKVGAPLKMADVRETITHLYTLARFEDVRVDVKDAANRSVAVHYEVVPIHTVTKVEFRGELGLSQGTLRTRMTERFGAAPPLARADDVAGMLEAWYHERGFLSATVKAAPPILEHEPHRTTLTFDVHAGSQTTIARSTITGHPLEPAPQVVERLHIAGRQPYQPEELHSRLTDYVTWMRQRRYYEASAHDLPPQFNADRTQVDLTVEIEPGPLVRVEFTGDPLPKDTIDELVPIEREGSIDQDILEDSARRIVDYLNQQGYWKAEVKPPERKQGNGEVTLVFHVSRGALFRVAPGGIDVSGNQSIGIDELRPLLKMPAGEPFVAAKLAAIEDDVKKTYRARGFATATIASAANDAGPGLVKPVITVKEGPRVTIGEVTVSGNTGLSSAVLLSKLSLKRGDPYNGPKIAAERDVLLAEYLNAGYGSAKVSVAAPAPVAAPGGGAVANIAFTIEEGPQSIVEHVFISGNVRTRSSVVRRELKIQSGKPLGLADLTETRRRLTALGLFRRIQITPVSHGDPSRTDVVILVEESPQTTVGFGGGVQVDRVLRTSEVGVAPSEQYEFAPRGFFEVGRRNLGGTNRSVNLYTRLSLRPNSDPANPNRFGFSEYRIIGTYTEPRALRNYGDLTVTAAVEQGVRTGFNFSRKGLNGEFTHRLSPTIRGSARYSLGTTRIFDFDQNLSDADKATIDRVFPQVRLSAFSAAASRDTRDSLLEPKKGTFLSADGTLAARNIGSAVGYAKTFLQGFVYRNLGGPGFVFAGGARLGLARGFPRLATTVDADGTPIIVTIRDLPASERFFAGGDTTMRGFALDSVGVPDTITTQGFPLGGDGEVILNAELRSPFVGPVGAVVFVDGGNVFQRAADLDLGQLTGSVGTGLRVKTPVGPVRFDVGFKLERRTIAGRLEPGYAVHFSIGQAF
ncbi:MAG TPA: POTRA domain-containing protein [Vicinamibacterales bacterium]|nr:POTRA domain-containing protein [Vicinamibacterales bacterium]